MPNLQESGSYLKPSTATKDEYYGSGIHTHKKRPEIGA